MPIYGRYMLPDCILSLTGMLPYHNSIYIQKIQDINDKYNACVSVNMVID